MSARERPVRVLVADDSLTVRKRLVEVLSAAPGLTVVGEAEDGLAAVEAVERLRPDVVTLDIVMPRLDGLAATERIMARTPTPIVVVSAAGDRTEALSSFAALQAGAVEVVDKPRGDEAPGAWEAALVETVRLAARIKVISHVRGTLAPRAVPVGPPLAASASVSAFTAAPPVAAAAPGAAAATPAAATLLPAPAPLRALALGASTGGPGALAAVLGGLPRGFDLPVLVVLHIGAPFVAHFVTWLARQTSLPVELARHGQVLPARGEGRVLLAPAGHHLGLRGGRVELSEGPPRHSCRPSVDVLFEAMARELGPEAAAVLLTGMGRDGAAGLAAVRAAGGVTVAQDAKTSVVYGMPAEAVKLGAAAHVLAVGDIGPFLGALAARRTGR